MSSFFGRIIRTAMMVAVTTIIVFLSSTARANNLPLYKTSYSHGITNCHLKAFNNAGDAIAFGSSTATFNVITTFLLRKEHQYDLMIQPGTNQVYTLVGADITQTNGNGGARVLATIEQQGLLKQGLVLSVNADGQVGSYTMLPFYVEPEQSAYWGETNVISPTAMNEAGEVVGPRGLGGVVRWFPPYDTAPTDSFFGYAKAYTPVDIDDSGAVLVSGDSFDVGGAMPRAAAALDTGGPTTEEVPYIEYISAYQETSGNVIRGGYVAGWAYVPNYDATYPRRAFVWKIGDTASTQLPDPVVPGYTVTLSEATSVNSSGDVVGRVNLSSLGYAGKDYPMLWKRTGNTYTPYLIYQLLATENDDVNDSAPTYGVGGFLSDGHVYINDAGQIAYQIQPPNNGEYQPDQVVVLDPLTTGVIEVTTQAPYVYEEDGKVTVSIKLTRAFGNTDPVSVNFATSNTTAQAGIRYIGTNGILNWASNESGSKNINISLIDDSVWSGSYPADFYLNLTGISGAALHNQDFSHIYVAEGYQSVQTVNGTNDASFSTPYAVAQGYDHVLVTLRRSGPGDGMMVISNLTTFNGTALAGTHYVAADKMVTWAAGDLSDKYVTINLLNGDLGGESKYFGIQGTSYLIDTNGNGNYNAACYGYVSIEPTGQIDQPSLGASPTYIQNASFGFDFSGVLGCTFAIEESTDLIHWTEVETVTATNYVEHFTLPTDGQNGGHYYRTHFK